MLSDWYKNNPNDKIWWRDESDEFGLFLFSFDKVHTYNFFADYPHKLTPDQIEIFKRENPILAQLKGV